MKQLILGTATFALVMTSACQNNSGQNEEAQRLAAEAIEIHDEIMPQISSFDKQDILIDSLLENLSALKTTDAALDTAETKEKLNTLKQNLAAATDKMMVWMKEYSKDSTDIDYQKAEIESISTLKTEFEQVTYDATNVLAPFKN